MRKIPKWFIWRFASAWLAISGAISGVWIAQQLGLDDSFVITFAIAGFNISLILFIVYEWAIGEREHVSFNLPVEIPATQRQP